MAEQKIMVQSNLPKQKDGGMKVAFYEKDDRYPEGEIFIGDDKPVEVFATAAVKTALNEGRLKEADGKEVKNAESATADNADEYSVEELRQLSRAELDALATEMGIEDADKMANKEEVARAIFDKAKE